MEAAELELSAKRVAEARADTSGRVYRVYADGVFDLFHVGHANMLRQAKHALGAPEKTHLLVGVCSDALTHAHKGKTILDHETRCASVAQCRWADEVVADAPWVVTQAFLDAHAIDFVAHDAAPYADSGSGSGDVYAFVKAQGRFLATQRTEGISTSDILLSIVRDYDAYVRRNLDRGYSPEQMNLGPLWRARATEKRRRSEVQRALQQTRADLHGVEDAALAFVRLFHPAGRAAVSPVAALLADPSPVRQRTMGVLHALRLLGRALRADCSSVGSYLNVFGYLPPRWRPFAAIAVACAACAAAVRLLHLLRHN